MDWETLKSWVETFKNTGAIAEHTTRMVRRKLEKENEKQTPSLREAYKARVRARRKSKDPWPEWDMIGRVAFDANENQWLTEMEYVPTGLRDAMTRLISARQIRPNKPVETGGEDCVYMLLIQKIGREATFCFFQKPT